MSQVNRLNQDFNKYLYYIFKKYKDKKGSFQYLSECVVHDSLCLGRDPCDVQGHQCSPSTTLSENRRVYRMNVTRVASRSGPLGIVSSFSQRIRRRTTQMSVPHCSSLTGNWKTQYFIGSEETLLVTLYL